MVNQPIYSMKRYFTLLILILIFTSCQHDIAKNADFSVCFSSDNTYLAGEPVRFDIRGDVDNILFYSGETGARYQYKDRETVHVDSVKTAVLDLSITPLYGEDAALEVYYSDSFEGLSGVDSRKDSLAIEEILSSNMEGWKRIDFVEGKRGQTIKVSADLTDFAGNVSLAFHWNPHVDPKTETQKTYYIDGTVRCDIKSALPNEFTLLDLKPVSFIYSDVDTVVVNDNPYKNTGSGSISLNTSECQICMQGLAADVDYVSCIDAWVFTTPSSLGHVQSDKGIVIKNMQNNLESYEYVWNEPGTYTVTFVGTCASHLGITQQIRELTVNVMEKVEIPF